MAFSKFIESSSICRLNDVKFFNRLECVLIFFLMVLICCHFQEKYFEKPSLPQACGTP
jgi:hypothetical protein